MINAAIGDILLLIEVSFIVDVYYYYY